MKKHVLFLFAALLPLVASAFKVNGISYHITSEADMTAEVTSGGDYSGSITIPATVTYKGVEYSVTSIGSSAFYNCSSLRTITIPEGVTSIGWGAFRDCSSLTAITLPESVTSIGGSAFSGCSSLTAINIPKGVTSIGEYAFRDCSSLTAINIPEGVTSIGEYAFRDCSSLTAITLPEGVTSIGESAFYYCSSLTAIILPESVTSIGESAFYECSSLTAINIPEGVTSIGERAFYECSSLTAITLPESVTSIGERAFYYCSILTAINIPENSRLTSIGYDAFRNCSSLTAINIPEGVTSIESNAFYNCSSLKELTLGKGLKKIATGAFNSCTALEKVTIYATRPPSIEGTGNAFFSDATYENATLYVPQGCIDKYQVMTGWSSFYTIEEMEGGTPNYLTLRQADNGEVGIVVDLGRTYKVRITAFEGWKIHSVTFNGEEVTDQLTEEGTFTTPALQADAVLNIAYEKTDNNTMVANTTARTIKVQGHQGTLRITGTTQGEAISVYTTDGTLVAQESAEGDETLLTLPTGQVYTVTVADKVVKIGL